MRWVQLCSSLNILWHCLSLGLKWKLTFSSPVATAEFPRFSGLFILGDPNKTQNFIIDFKQGEHFLCVPTAFCIYNFLICMLELRVICLISGVKWSKYFIYFLNCIFCCNLILYIFNFIINHFKDNLQIWLCFCYDMEALGDLKKVTYHW